MWPAGHGDWGLCWPRLAVMLKCWGSRKYKHWPCVENISHGWPGFPSECSSSSHASRSESCSSPTLLLLQQELNSAWKGSPEPQAPAWATCTGTAARSPSALSPHKEWRRAAFPLQRNHMAQYIHILAASSITGWNTKWGEKPQPTADFHPFAAFTAEPPHLQHVIKSFLWCESWLRVASVVLLNWSCIFAFC